MFISPLQMGVQWSDVRGVTVMDAEGIYALLRANFK